VDEEVEFAASHFYELDPDDLQGIGGSILEEIVGSQWLRLPNEDSLLNFIGQVDSEDQTRLLRYLRIEYLSCEAMKVFLEQFADSILDPAIWESLCYRLLLPVSPSSSERSSISASRFNPGVEFPMKEVKSLEGIVSYLYAEYGDVIKITSKSEGSLELYPAGYANGVSSKDHPGQWVCWDFRKMWIYPTHYTINSYNLRSWILEGSVDGRTWTEIDRQADLTDFKDGTDPEASFAVSNPFGCRFIRLTQTGKNWDGSDRLSFHAAEFFGTLFE
jgi:hypothetical protein